MKKILILLWVFYLPIAVFSLENINDSINIKDTINNKPVYEASSTAHYDKNEKDQKRRTYEDKNSNNKLISKLNLKNIFIMTMILLAVVVIGLFYIYKLNNEINTLKKKTDKSKGRPQDINEIKELKTLLNNLSNKIKEINILKDSIDNIKKDLDSLKVKMEELQKKEEIKNQITSPQELEDVQESQAPQKTEQKEEVIEQTKKIYFPSPMEESKFSNDDLSEECTSSSLYEVIFDIDTKTGEFSILDDIDISPALNSPDMYLKPVCEFMNEHRPDYHRAETIKKGKIKLEGDNWIVTEKTKIKFI